jgi:hypothetical protein
MYRIMYSMFFVFLDYLDFGLNSNVPHYVLNVFLIISLVYLDFGSKFQCTALCTQ